MILKTKQDLEPIKERERKATKGPWVKGKLSDSSMEEVFSENVALGQGVATSWFGRIGDTDFIAHSRQDIPNLLETVDALMEENEALRSPENYKRFTEDCIKNQKLRDQR